MKRIISFFLTLCILMTGFVITASPVTAQEESKIDTWEIMKGIGLIDFDDSVKAENITRAEYASIIAEIVTPPQTYVGGTFGKTDIADSFVDTQYIFSDVSSESEYYKAVSKAVESGIMNGLPDGSFNPEGTLKYEEALKTIVMLCGYEEEALIRGGWFIGYHYVADRLDLLLSNKTTGQYMTKADVAELLYRAIDVDVRYANRYFADYAFYTEGDSFLNTFMDMEYAKGVVTEVENTTLTTAKKEIGRNIVVDGTSIMNDLGLETNKFLGREVKAFYRVDDGGIKRLIYIVLNSRNEEVTVIPAENIKKYDGANLSYTSGSSTKKVEIKGSAVIYNGAALTSYSRDLFDNIEVGDVTVIKNDDLKVVKIRDFKSMVISAVSSNDYSLYSEDGDAVSLDSDTHLNHIYNKKSDGGKLLEFGDIASNTPVSVIMGSNYTEVYICENYQTGTIFTVDTEYGAVEIEQESQTEFKTVQNAHIKAKEYVGKKVRFYTDIFGNVFKFALDSGNEIDKGILAGVSGVKGLASRRIKIFRSDETFVTYDVANTVRFYGSDSTKAVRLSSEDLDGAKGLNGYRRLISYKVNSNDEIVEIAMPLTSLDDKTDGDGRVLERIFPGNPGNIYRAYSSSIGAETFLDENTKVFGVPLDRTDLESYVVGKKSDFHDGMRVTAVDSRDFSETDANALGLYYSYFEDMKDPIADAVILINWSYENKRAGVNDFYVVQKITDSIDAYGDPIVKLTLVDKTNAPLSGYVKKTDKNGVNIAKAADDMNYLFGSDNKPQITDEKEAIAIAKGDIVYISKLADGEIVYIACLWDSDKTYTPGGKKGAFAAVKTGTDQYYIQNNTTNKDLIDRLYNNPDKYLNVDEVLNGNTDASINTICQNPMRFDLMDIATEGGFYRTAMKHYYHAYRGNQEGAMHMVGYVVKKAPGFVKLTTQDLSVDGAVYNELGIPADAYTQGDDRIGIYHQHWFNYVTTSTKILLIEYYDDGIKLDYGTPEDIVSWEEGRNEASRIIASSYRNAYFIINDYRTR